MYKLGLNVIMMSLLLVLASMRCVSQSDINYVVDFITVKDGLSHNYATSIVSDDLNLKWIGTENGITKYNGYDFEYIKPGEDYRGLLNENIEVLFTDRNSKLWIGTKSGGASFLNVRTNEMKHYNHLIDFSQQGDIRVTSFAEDHLGQIWIGTWKSGVFVIDTVKDELIKHFNYNEPIYSIRSDYNNNVWFCSGYNIYQYNIQQNILQNFNFEQQVNDILPDESRQRVWISTNGENQKLFYYDQFTKTIKDITTGVGSNFSKRLILDHKNRIWIGTWGRGVYRSNTDLSEFIKIDLFDDTKDHIPGNFNTILSIHEDKNKMIWLTTASGGVIQLVESTGFQNIRSYTDNSDLERSLNCTSIHKTNDNIFVGTLFSGLYVGEDFKTLKKLNDISNEKINCLYQFQDRLFIGSAMGFYIYDLNEDKIVLESKSIKKVTAILIDEKDVYIGTQQDGIITTTLEALDDPSSFNIYSEDLTGTQYIESNRITAIKKDLYNNIWVSSYNGLHLYKKNTQSFVHQSELADEELPIGIINGFEINKDRAWLATPNGLIKLNIQRERIQVEKTISKRDGLNSDFISALTIDAFDNIWFSNQTEILKYNDRTNSFISYSEINGIKSSLFNNNAVFNFENQGLYFGGIDNVTFFNPQEVSSLELQPEVIFTNLIVKNRDAFFDSKRDKNYLDQSINYAQQLELKHTEDFFSTRFVANDFLGKGNIHYRYKLENSQKEWINLHGMNELNFTGLLPGNYTLQVQASRDNQNWSPSKTMLIKLKNSPWKTGWAYSGYALLLIIIMTYLVRLNNKRIKLQNSLEIAKIEQEKKVELANSKLNFFTNISHEFRTPLTLMISPLKEVLEYENLPKKVYNKLNYVEKNTSRLLNLVNQLLDFRKSEYGILKISASYGNFVNFAYEVFLYFKESAKAKSITYKYKASEKDITFPFDRNKMEIVLCNLLSNAIKFTPEGGEVNVIITTNNNEECVITIQDNGIGMKSQELDKIFDKFYQIKNSNTAKMVGSGLGLTFSKKIIELHHGSIEVESKENEGTRFIMKVTINANNYKGEINEKYRKTDDIKAYESLDHKKHQTLKPGSSKPEILIVDDNPDILNYLSEVLGDKYLIRRATNGDEGVKEALKHSPDLILSDVMMPVKDGISLCKELKTNINTSHIPIILLTARTSTVFEIDGLKHGADDYITKPFNADVVLARILSQLENREKIKSHFLNIIRFEPKQNDEESLSGDDKFIQKAIALVEGNLQDPDFGIEDMTEELGMSRSSLFRKIKSLTGLSLSAFIRSIRVKNAAQIILNKNLSLKEVAYEVGFNTYKYFKQSFEKQYDCLPSAYRDMMKNKDLEQ
jgi:signal transduction histidine kinase/ligand-binding sensor domain-containing protein/AraC-like DNA-binding protein